MLLIHGAGDSGWYWHLVDGELRERGHNRSFGGYIAPIVCDRVPARLLVLIAGMVPSPSESAEQMFANTEYKQEKQRDRSDRAVFYHDVPPGLSAEAIKRGRKQSSTPSKEPWPLTAWPNVPTRYVLCRNDRLLPREWVRRVVRDRLGITPDEIDSGHCPALSRPRELADLLATYWADVQPSS
jgi:pimeloyl-ACP methyl ester carboxylesterase